MRRCAARGRALRSMLARAVQSCPWLERRALQQMLTCRTKAFSALCCRSLALYLALRTLLLL